MKRPDSLPLMILVLLLPILRVAGAAAGDNSFDEANRLYEEQKYHEAARAYEHLIREGPGTSTLYFNLGNAWHKAGQQGRAIAAYLKAQRLTPRDPNLRFNLQFVREQISADSRPVGAWWQRWLANLTVNEWTVLFLIAFWIWFLLLALREWRVTWRKTLSGYTAASGLASLVLLLCLLAGHRIWSDTSRAVVIVQKAVVRLGPLEESKVHYQLRDGEEISVQDEKAGETTWLQVTDSQGREGWLKEDEVIRLNPPDTPPAPEENET